MQEEKSTARRKKPFIIGFLFLGAGVFLGYWFDFGQIKQRFLASDSSGEIAQNASKTQNPVPAPANAPENAPENASEKSGEQNPEKRVDPSHTAPSADPEIAQNRNKAPKLEKEPIQEEDPASPQIVEEVQTELDEAKRAEPANETAQNLKDVTQEANDPSQPKATDEIGADDTVELDPALPQPLPFAPLVIDLVRVDAEGAALIAGAAQPGAKLYARLDDQEFSGLAIPENGKFVYFLELGNSDEGRILTLWVLKDDIKLGDDMTLLIAPSPVNLAENEATVSVGNAETGQEQQQESAQERLVEATAQPTPEAQAEIESVAIKPPEREAAPIEQAQTSVILLDQADQVSVLQSASDQPPDVTERLALDTISYDAVGKVSLSGQTASDGNLRVYLDNRAIAQLAVEQPGQWQLSLPQVDKGLYTLRVDQVDASGKVTERVETPFQREDDTRIAAQGAVSVTVQPGSTLWAIARDRYGKGILYVRVFDANKDQIRDPDLIYPGQIFDLPQ